MNEISLISKSTFLGKEIDVYGTADLPLFKASDYSFTFHSSPDSLKEEINDVVSSVSEAINKVLQAES